MRAFEWRVRACFLTITLCLRLSYSSKGHEYRNCTVLQLLNVQPYPDDGIFAGFDRGLDLIPAAHLAAQEINNRSDILAGFDLQIVDIDSEACGREIITKGLINFYRELVTQDPTRCIAGVMGFVCSSVTNILAPIIGHQNIGYIVLTNSVSPSHWNSVEYPNLFHTISSSSVHNEALVSLMQRFNWRRIGIIYDSITTFYHTTATDFLQRVHNLTEAELTVSIPIINSHAAISKAFNTINTEGARITYWQANDDQNALCLCEAYHRQFLYPGHGFILRYNPTIIDNLLNAETGCSREELLLAMEGVLMLDYRLKVDDDTVLFSGWKYSDFRQRYAEELEEYAKITNYSLKPSIYGNSFYDQVWAFALSLNNSLLSIHSRNLSFSNYTFGNIGPISNIIKHELMKLSFQGASGLIDFSDNQAQRNPTYVNIFQIQKGKLKLIGVYDPYHHNVTLTEAAPSVSDVPPDTFETVYQLLPLWLGICLLTSQGILFGLITTNLILIVKWRNEKDIKAISPLLSLLMMIGCYSLCVTPAFLIAYRMFALSNMAVVKSLCYLKTWTWMGTDLILAILFLKLLRVYHIFRTFRKTSRHWSDHYLFIYSLAICAGKVVLVIILNSTNSIYIDNHKGYVNAPDRLPYYVATVTCNTSGAWLAAAGLYSGVLLFLVVILAVATRHIKKDHFKDTKKVNAFIYMVVIIIVTNTSLRIFFDEEGNQTGADIAEWLPSFAIPLLCEVCLFFPKTLPLALRKIQSIIF